MKARLMICLVALSVALTGCISCFIASHIHWYYKWITAPAILPGLSFGLVTAGWLLYRRWIGRGKAAGLVVGSTVAYFAAYWSAFYIVALCGRGMILSESRLPLFHAGMIAGVVGTVLLTASLAAVSADFRHRDWKTLILIGAAAGGALCLAGIGAQSSDHAGTLGNPGDRVFILVWQLLVSGYIGVLLFGARSFSSGPSERGRIAQWAPRAVLILLLASLIHVVIGYSRVDKERMAAAAASPQPSASPPVAAQPGNPALMAGLLLGAAALEANSAAEPSTSPRKIESSHPRSEESLAVERYLRSRLVGGLTENQVIELSDAIATEFDAADLPPKEREWCFSGKGDKRQMALCTIYELYNSSSLASSEAKVAAKQLADKILHMIPPRAVFSGLFDNSSSERPVKEFPVEKPLPPIDRPIEHGYRPAGALVRERLQSLETVIRIMSDDNRTADRAFDMVKSLGANDQADDASLAQYFERGPAVLVCGYQGGFKDTSWKRLFWYKEDSKGLEQLLKSLPADHPIREIGPARKAAPSTLELALKANPHSADQLLKDIAEEKERAERPPPGPELTNAEKFWAAIGVLATAAIVSERIVENQAEQQRDNVRKIVEASGGTKMECPKCNGSGKIFYTTYDNSTNPYP